MDITPNNIIVFDGICNFCNGSVNFIIKRDNNKIFYFSPMQSDFGNRLLKTHGIATDNLETFVLFRDRKAYTKSDAALLIAQQLNKPWNWLSICLVIPSPIRDAAYSFIAKNRYKWFGKRSQCMIPTPEQKQRFIL